MTADVIVVGAGIVGAACADLLTEFGQRVTVDIGQRDPHALGQKAFGYASADASCSAGHYRHPARQLAKSRFGAAHGRVGLPSGSLVWVHCSTISWHGC